MRAYIGYSRRDHSAYEVCKYSLLRHSPYSTVTPIVQDQLRANGIYTRGKDLLDSTGFSMTRYLTPHMAGYDGFALYADCDTLFTCDANELIEAARLTLGDAAVWVVKHFYVPKDGAKADGQRQILYPRKNWSSLILFDCSHPLCRRLTPNIVNAASIPTLNELRWGENSIGTLPPKYNFLVGEYVAPDENARTLKEPGPLTPRILHFTRGSENWLKECQPGDYDVLWREYQKQMRAEISDET